MRRSYQRAINENLSGTLAGTAWPKKKEKKEAEERLLAVKARLRLARGAVGRMPGGPLMSRRQPANAQIFQMDCFHAGEGVARKILPGAANPSHHASRFALREPLRGARE